MFYIMDHNYTFKKRAIELGIYKNGHWWYNGCYGDTANYKKIPEIVNFIDENGNDTMAEQIQLNYERIKRDVQQIVDDEINRIKNDPDLKHLIKEEKK